MFRKGRGAPQQGTLGNKRSKRAKAPQKEATTYQKGLCLGESSSEEIEEVIEKYRNDHDIIYTAAPIFNHRDVAVLPFVSKELYFEIISIKLGLILAGSYYGEVNGLQRQDARVSRLDVGSIARRSMCIHLVPKGCGRITEAVLKYFIGEELGHCIRGEHMSISNDMRKLISTFFSEDKLMGMPYASLKDQSIARGNVIDLFRQIQSRSPQQVMAMTNASNTWKAEMSAYTPRQLTTAIDLSSMNEQFFGGDFTTLLDDGIGYNCIIFDLETIDQDTMNKLLRIQFGIYATGIVSPSRPEDATPHDGYFTSIVKFGILDGGSSNPYERMNALQMSSSSKLQMMIFPSQDGATAKLLEDCIHKDLSFLKHHGEWSRTLRSQLKRFVVDHQDFVDGQGRLDGITRANLTNVALDLSQQDTEVSAVDQLVRTLLPLNEIPPHTLTRVYNTGQQKFIVSLTENDWFDILRVARLLIQESEGAITGSELVDALLLDNRLDLRIGRRTNYLFEQLRWNLPKVLGVTLTELRSSTDPGEFLDRIFGDLPELKQQTLHNNWYLWMSMKHGISRVQKHIYR